METLSDKRFEKKNEIEGTKYYMFLEYDVKESISKLKDKIIENDIYTADEIFRLINEEFGFFTNKEDKE